MSSETTSGKAFMSKKQNPGVIVNGQVFEELMLTQLIQLQFSENDIDMAAIHLQFNQLLDADFIQPKTLHEVTKKVVSYLTNNEVFQNIFKDCSQIWTVTSLAYDK